MREDDSFTYKIKSSLIRAAYYLKITSLLNERNQYFKSFELVYSIKFCPIPFESQRHKPDHSCQDVRKWCYQYVAWGTQDASVNALPRPEPPCQRRALPVFLRQTDGLECRLTSATSAGDYFWPQCQPCPKNIIHALCRHHVTSDIVG